MWPRGRAVGLGQCLALVCVFVLAFQAAVQLWPKDRDAASPPCEAKKGARALEDAVRAAVERLALDSRLAAAVGARLLGEVSEALHGRDAILWETSKDRGVCDVRGYTTSRDSVLGNHNVREDRVEANVLPGRAPARPGLPPLYVVTPTYRRPDQLAQLTALAQTLLLVPNVRWLLVEDAESTSENVAALLRRSRLPYEHLAVPMPEQYLHDDSAKPKGVAQRNRALAWLRANASSSGVFYFADDDNTYDVDIFEEIRTTQRVSMFPVGLCTNLGVSSPVVSSTGEFLGFYDGWIGGRKFPVDMAGFAVSVRFLLERPNATMPFDPGFEEDGFLTTLKPLEPMEIELKAANCSRILVWHTRAIPLEPAAPVDMIRYNQTNIAVLRNMLV